MPKVSVIIPTYNYAHFVIEALQSVEDQTFQDWECIIVDDGSKDNTSEIVPNWISYQKDPSKYKYIVQENAGLPATRNRGIRESTGEYIIPLDADDFFYPECLEKMVELLDSNPDIDIATSNVRHVGEWCDDTIMFDSIHDPRQVSGAENNVSPTSMYRRYVWEAVGGYDESLRGCPEDWDFWFMCIEKNFQSKKVNMWLSASRTHSTSKGHEERASLGGDYRSRDNVVLAKHNKPLR